MFHQVGDRGEYDGPKQNAGTKRHQTLHIMQNIIICRPMQPTVQHWTANPTRDEFSLTKKLLKFMTYLAGKKYIVPTKARDR